MTLTTIALTVFYIALALALLHRLFKGPNRVRQGPPVPFGVKLKRLPVQPLAVFDTQANANRTRFLQWVIDQANSRHYQDSEDCQKRATLWYTLAAQETNTAFWLTATNPLATIAQLEGWS